MLASSERMTVEQVKEFIRSQINMRADDRTTAEYLHKSIKMSQKLEDSTESSELQKRYGSTGPRTSGCAPQEICEEESARLAAAPPPPAPAPEGSAEAPRRIPMEQAEVIAAMREYALNYTKSLPNYICAQITRRHQDAKDPRYRPQGDVIQEQLSFFDQERNLHVGAV